MAENCNHDCGSCGQDCADRTAESFLAQANPGSHIKKVIGVVSGKGGVGKSLVTSILASAMKRKGKNVGILDADITGPSIPMMFGVDGQEIIGTDNGFFPALSRGGIEVMSVNLVLDDPSAPVIWRGPIIAGTVKQFWTDIVWGDLDVLFVDMPPGTGDVPLTVFQSLPVDGIVVVTSPQELVSMIVGKAVKMAEMMNIPVLGLVENMSYLACPDCGKKIELFGKSRAEEAAQKYGIENFITLPIMPELAELSDQGLIEDMPETLTDEAVKLLQEL